jgi:hypothetical protein
MKIKKFEPLKERILRFLQFFKIVLQEIIKKFK